MSMEDTYDQWKDPGALVDAGPWEKGGPKYGTGWD